MKYIKWICLSIAILGIIILSIIFINNNNKPQEQKFNISDIYNTAWYKKGVAFYENGILFNENLELEDIRYIVFYKNYAEYHNPKLSKKDTYTYTYNQENQTITINSEDYLLEKGTYNIDFENNYLKIYQLIDEKEYVYYFKSSEG